MSRIPPGRMLGPYEIISALGEGGMGEVYRARDTRLDRQVAVKALARNLASDEDALRRFHHEARAIAALFARLPREGAVQVQREDRAGTREIRDGEMKNTDDEQLLLMLQ